MSLYMQTDKPATASRSRVATSKDVFSSGEKLNRVVPKNPKFAHVQATIDTGANVANVKPKIDRSGEMFRRVNRRQLHHLMLACEKGEESIYELQENWDGVEDTMDETMSVQSGRTVGSTMSSSSTSSSAYMPIVATHDASRGADTKQTNALDYFILLDMREDDEAFRKCHIEGAIHYPPALLRRDHFPPALYKMKNAPNKLIILYDIDETARSALESCTLFIQKGFTNTFLLTGGLKHFGDRYHSRLVGEQVPPPPKAPKSSISSRSQAMAGTPAGGRLHTGASTATSSRLHTGSVSSRSQMATPNHSNPTSLGYQLPNGRESPRVTLGRQQQAASSSSSSSSSASSRTTTRPPPTASSQISSRAFR